MKNQYLLFLAALIVAAMLTAPAAEAAWVFEKIYLRPSAEAGMGQLAPYVRGESEASYRIEGAVWDYLLSTVAPLPITLSNNAPVTVEASSSWKMSGEASGSQSPVLEQCLFSLGLSNLTGLARCDVDNDHLFSPVAPGRQVEVVHASDLTAEAIGWSSVTITIGPPYVGLGWTLNAANVIPAPRTFATDPIHLTTPACPADRPWYDEGVCKACPLTDPLYDPESNSCRDCPSGTFWDGYACTDTPAPTACPSRQRWSDVEQSCVCTPDFNPWREYDTAPLECLTDQEVIDRIGDSGGDWRVEDDRDTGRVRVTICKLIKRTEEFYEIYEGEPILVYRLILTRECTVEFFAYKAGASDLEGKACHDGLGWKACEDAPMPTWIEPHLPPVDLMSVFGPCYWVDDIQITACDGTGTPVLPSQPDLRVGPAFVLNPVLVPGDPIRLRVTVSNAGGVTAPNSELEIRWLGPDGIVRPQRLWIGSLASRQSRDLLAVSDVNIPSPFTAALGAYDIDLVADVAGVVAEADESNNQKSLAFEVSGAASGGPDLRVGQLVVDPQNPAASGHVEITLVIDNVGDQVAGASRHRLRLTSPDGQTVVENRDTGALAPGGFLLDTFDFVAGAAGGYVVEVLADAFDEVAETQDRNNRGALLFEVYGDTPCLPCTSGAPGNQVGAAVCLDHANGIPHEGARWQCLGVRADGSSCVPSGNHPNGWAPVEDRCDAPEDLCAGTLHPDRCGNPGICPGTALCP